MTDPSSGTVLRMSSSGDLIGALSAVLGFVPSESLVAVCTSGPRRRLGLTMRLDLDLALELDPDELAGGLMERIMAADADEVFFVLFSDGHSPGDPLPWRWLVRELIDHCGPMVLDVILASDGRWWSYVCDDLDCCGPPGTPIDLASPGVTAVSAAYALAGHATLPSREALVASVAYSDRPGHRTAMADLIGTARVKRARQARRNRRRAVVRLALRLMDEVSDPRNVLADADVADLVALCDDVVVRDEVLVLSIEEQRRHLLVRVLIEAAHAVPEPFDAPICTTLAWVAYSMGDGTLANVALDRALSTDPDYYLALLVAKTVYEQISPADLCRVTQIAAQDMQEMG